MRELPNYSIQYENITSSSLEPPRKNRKKYHNKNDNDDSKKITTTTITTILDEKEVVNKIHPFFLDCHIIYSNFFVTQQQSFKWIINKLREKRKRNNITLKGDLTKIAGKNDSYDFGNSLIQDVQFKYPYFLKYYQNHQKLFISDCDNHIIRSISNISIDKNDKVLEIEVGQPKQEGYSNGDRNTCKLRYPNGFDWDMDDNMYICNFTCICKVDGKSNQVSLVAGHATDGRYKDGNNDEARFNNLTGILCYQRNYQLPLVLYVCDFGNHCIRMIDVTNDKTTTFTGNGQKKSDEDGTLQSARFHFPWDIIQDDDSHLILYVSDSGNHKIKMIDMKKGMVTTFVGNKNVKSILNKPQQMQMIDSFIYVVCHGNHNCIVKIDKETKQVTKMKYNDGNRVKFYIHGITYHELDQCFYISDDFNIYKLE